MGCGLCLSVVGGVVGVVEVSAPDTAQPGRCPAAANGRRCFYDAGHGGKHFAKDSANYYVWGEDAPDTQRPDVEAIREHVAHIARGCRSGLSHNPTIHEHEIDAALDRLAAALAAETAARQGWREQAQRIIAAVFDQERRADRAEADLAAARRVVEAADKCRAGAVGGRGYVSVQRDAWAALMDALASLPVEPRAPENFTRGFGVNNEMPTGGTPRGLPVEPPPPSEPRLEDEPFYPETTHGDGLTA